MNNIKKLRLEKQYSQKQVAKLLDIVQSSYSDYETNEAIPKADTLKKLAQLYGVSINYILGFSENRLNMNILIDGVNSSIQKFKRLNDLNKIKAISFISGLIFSQGD